MSDIAVTLNTGTVAVNVGNPGEIRGSSLTTAGKLVKVTAASQIGEATIAESAITGLLTITKSGSTARTVTFPDAAITISGSASPLTAGRVPFATTGGLLTDEAAFAYDSATNTLTLDVVKTGTSAGFLVKNTGGTTVATFGAGGGTGTAFADGVTCAAITSTSSSGITQIQAATQDGVAIKGRAGGTGSYIATITPPTLSSSITITLPAVTSTLAVLGANTWTGAQVFQDQITTEAIFRDVLSVVTAAGTTTGDATDHVVVFTGSTTQTYTMPAAAAGREIIIKNRSTGNVTINRAGSDTIDGGTSVVLTTNQWVKLVANGTDWCIVG